MFQSREEAGHGCGSSFRGAPYWPVADISVAVPIFPTDQLISFVTQYSPPHKVMAGAGRPSSLLAVVTRSIISHRLHLVMISKRTAVLQLRCFYATSSLPL